MVDGMNVRRPEGLLLPAKALGRVGIGTGDPWDMLILRVPEDDRERIRGLLACLDGVDATARMGPFFAGVILAEGTPADSWHDRVGVEVHAVFDRVEARDGMVELLPNRDQEVFFRAAAQQLGVPSRTRYPIVLAYAKHQVDVTPQLRVMNQLLARFAITIDFDFGVPTHLRSQPGMELAFEIWPHFN
jgi:hypothetical protein